MKEGTQPTNWVLSKPFIIIIIILLVFSRLFGWHRHNFILDTFSKVPLYCLSEVYNFDVVILCGPSLIFAGYIFGGEGGGGEDDEPFEELCQPNETISISLGKKKDALKE
jgi:hypothetical protein